MPPKGWDKNKSRKKVTSCSSARQYKHHPRKRVMRLRYSKAETLGFLAKGYNDAVEIRQHRMFRFICKKSASSLHLTHSVFSSIAQGFGDFKRKGGICACMVDLKGSPAWIPYQKQRPILIRNTHPQILIRLERKILDKLEFSDSAILLVE